LTGKALSAAVAFLILFNSFLRMSLFQNLFNPAHLPIGQANLDTVGVRDRFGEDIFDKTPGQLPTALIFFQHDGYFDSGSYVSPILSDHPILSITPPLPKFFGQSRL
jgi:hypothetical protein